MQKSKNRNPSFSSAIKRAIDVVCAVAALASLAPVFLLIVVAIRLSSPGPVIYRGLRVGLNRRPFTILKFRTMVVDAERLGGSCTSADDQRITPIGRWLRKYKLDELPQLVNVLIGEMSLVGPRPEIPRYVAMFSEEEHQILTVRPGITDWATLWNSDEGERLAGRADPERVYIEEIRPEKIRLQLKYVRERNLAVDARIVVATCALVLSRCVGIETQRATRIHTGPYDRTNKDV